MMRNWKVEGWRSRAECEVTCADGKGGKVTLECEDGLVEVTSDSSEGAGTVQVRCGSAEEVDKKVEAVRSMFRSALVYTEFLTVYTMDIKKYNHRQGEAFEN